MRGRAPTARWSVVLDSPDPRALAGFYAGLLDWELGTDEPDWVTLRPPEGPGYLAFQREERYVRPTWPARGGKQQMSMHLDLAVTDLDAAVTSATEAGAELVAYQPQDDVRVMLDPDGHPFCLWLDDETS
ncbi:MAG: VOC family protein [Actinomycetota bacterium]